MHCDIYTEAMLITVYKPCSKSNLNVCLCFCNPARYHTQRAPFYNADANKELKAVQLSSA